MYKVTIGVPVYNSAKLIRKALDSFVEQTMNDNDFEVICVDDCSTDNSIKVIKEYQKKLNLRIFKLKENSGGPGEPRNKVIEQAKGEFIFFVDSDDYINPKTLENSYNFAKKNHSDIVLVKMKGVNGRGVPQSMFKETNPNVDLYNSRLMYALNPLKLFKTTLLRNNNITFPTDVRAAEDQVFVVKSYVLANKISILSDIDYYYATRHDGEHMTFTDIEPQDYYKVMCDTVDSIYEHSTQSNERKDLLTASFINRHFNGSRTTNTTIKRTEATKRKKWLDLLHNFIKNHVPTSVDKFLDKEVRIRVTLARVNDQVNYAKYESLMYKNEYQTIVNNNKILTNFTFLNDYPNLEALDVTKDNKLVHHFNNLDVSNGKIKFGCFVKHSHLNQLNNEQRVHAVFINRKTKKIIKLLPILINENDNYYYFETYFDLLITSQDDMGIWDLSIVSTINSFELMARLGNKKETSISNNVTLFGTSNNVNYIANTFFTEYGNFSIRMSSKYSSNLHLEMKVDKRNNQLELIGQSINLSFPKHSTLKITFSNRSAAIFLIGNVYWDKKDSFIQTINSRKYKLNELFNYEVLKLEINNVIIS